MYGPTSVIYGANAFMGVVNVITKKAKTKRSAFLTTRASTRGDTNFEYLFLNQAQHFDARFGLHYEEHDIGDRVNNQANYWLQDRHYNPQLWGAFVTNSKLVTPRFESKTKRIGLEGALKFEQTEINAFYLLEENGYGSTYPSDRLPASGKWPIFQYGLTLKHQLMLSSALTSRTQLTYRRDGVQGNAYDIEAWNITNTSAQPEQIGGVILAPNEQARMLHFQHWLTDNKSFSINQDFDYQYSETLSLYSGFAYSYQDLQQAYILSGLDSLSPLASLPTPPKVATGAYQNDDNRETWKDIGVYMQTEYNVKPNHVLNGGLRYDNNNIYGSELTMRGAYIYHRDNWNFKVMYGEAYHEPTPRNLYGAWSGSGADAELSAERSNTLEMSLSYSKNNYRHLFSLYRINNSDSIVTVEDGARNLGARNVLGFDYHFITEYKSEHFGDINFTLHATHYAKAEEDIIDPYSQLKVGETEIGDLAHDKLWLIINWQFNKQLNANFKTRFIGKRNSIESNPIRQLPGYAVSDLHITYTPASIENVNFHMRITNLFNKSYFHPGVRDADAGDPLYDSSLFNTIGFSESNPKAWNGSLGWYNSRLPQPTRRIVLGVDIRF